MEDIQNNNLANPKLHKKPKSKTVTIRHHHSKPYRKRHFVSFAFMFIGGIFFLGLGIKYNVQLKSGIKSAKDYIIGSTAIVASNDQTISSTYGFSINFDSRQLYASGIDSTNGDLFIGNELSVLRPYELIRMSPSLGDVGYANSNLTVKYYSKDIYKDTSNLSAVEALVIKDITAKATLIAKKTGTSNVVLGNKSFIKSDWMFSSGNHIFSGINPSFTTYVGVINNKTIVIEVMDSNLSGNKVFNYDSVINSLNFDNSKTTYINQTAVVKEKIAKSRNLIESALFGQLAFAQSLDSEKSSESISSVYGPSVVKIFNVYCQDIYFDGNLAIKDACSGSTGSGFFINQSGYIASNGHVTNSDVKDILIQFAFSGLLKGDAKLVDFLALKANITASDLPIGSDQEQADYLFDRLYKIKSSRITTKNSVVNLLVALAKDSPDVKELIDVTNSRKEYAEQKNVKRAKPVAQDFRSVDGITQFHSSDVSIIKIEGQDYPVAKLGSILNLMQGANLNILGYPGNATNNGIVDSALSSVTLTSGKVSAIKNALGSTKKLIETDTTIGHGNSGGPAFNDSGEVVGISTYTATKDGDGTYNYVRDIQDLKDLASANNVVIDPASATQTSWELALGNFNSAHYSKSVKGFADVKKLYSSHPNVDEFIAAANQNIKNGKDINDFPIITVLIGGIALLIGSAVAVLVIYRHKKIHNVYKAQVANGAMDPVQSGTVPQKVTYDSNLLKR